MSSVSTRRRWRAGVVALVVAAVAAGVRPVLGVPLGAALWWAPLALAGRRERAHSAAVAGDVPLLAELFSIAARAGLTVPLAVGELAGHVGGAVGDELRRAAAAHADGERLVDALAAMADALGPPVRPLVAVLVAAVRDGDPIVPALDRVADALHDDARRRAEVRARRLSLQLLAPLVLCTLPAFALLTVVPLLTVSLHSLPR